MKIAYIGTYAPRECGIATFTQNKFRAMMDGAGEGEPDHEGMIIAVTDHENAYAYPEEVKFSIRQQQQTDYLEAARVINKSGADICILEHEFGIFGGQSGIYLLPLLHRLEIPFIAVLHTVLKEPSINERAVLTEVCKMAAKIVVMSHKAVEFLTTVYGVPKEKIKIVEHGVPDLQYNQEESKKRIWAGA